MKFKLTVPEGTTLHRHLSGMDPRARNFELLTLAAMGLQYKDGQVEHKIPAHKEPESVAEVSLKPLFELDELALIGS